MAKVWCIPEITSMCNTGPEWLLHSMADLNDGDRLRLLMLLWRCWHVRNEITHHKPAPPVEASKRFLQSYVSSLMNLQHYSSVDLVKGKMVADEDGVAKPLLHVKLLSHHLLNGSLLLQDGPS